MIRGILIALLACVISFSAEASAKVVVAKSPAKGLSAISASVIGKIFRKNDTLNERYEKANAKRRRLAQSHRRSLLRSQSTR